MAEVLPPFSQPSSTITMLHSRPSSADAFQPSQQQYSSSQRLGQHTPRSLSSSQAATYRASSAPVQPYAFRSTPHQRLDSRSGPVTGMRHAHSPSASAASTASTGSSLMSTKDDSVIGSSKSVAVSVAQVPWQLPELSLPALDLPVKHSPERYRRPAQKRVDSNDSTHQGQHAQSPRLEPQAGGPRIESPRNATVDDLAVPRNIQSTELPQRYRRRSLHQLDGSNAAITQPDTWTLTSTHNPSPSPLNSNATDTLKKPIATVSPVAVPSGRPVSPVTQQKSSTPAPRSTTESTRRAVSNPSPLGKQSIDQQRPVTQTPAPRPKTYASVAQSAMTSPSPAVAHLAAVSDRDLNKGMKSRLRRAFSFGSGHELRRAAGENNQSAAQQARQQAQQQIPDDELDAEQMEIARRQEAAGIGAGIYSGQGGFAGSTDNLSISSTASSASMMLRKMGRGAKKGARSVKGLFRPKSVIGVPAADGPIQQSLSASAKATGAPTLAEVSMVTVEAERLNVNVNAHPDERAGGTTGYPKLERNSLDAANAAASAAAARDLHGNTIADHSPRRVLNGVDRERAEILAAVKKGILKRSGTSSPASSPAIVPYDAVPSVLDSPGGSDPGAQRELLIKARSTSMTTAQSGTGNGDYFVPRLAVAGGNQSAHSLPNTPGGTQRSISFSPRIQFHDVWSSTEYDRRSELATCNRLTPLLAQQIKEELNTFKMEMEVHELSKPHTHFF